MPQPPPSPLIATILRSVARRYRLPAASVTSSSPPTGNPATTLAIVIEQARLATVRGEVPGAQLKLRFAEALSQMIREAMRAGSEDPVFQAMVLRHQAAQVREYVALSAHAVRDRRFIRTTIDAIAHPAKLQRSQPSPLREALTQLHASASSENWPELAGNAQRLLAEACALARAQRSLTSLLNSQELERLQRLDALNRDKLVQQYQSLRDKHGHRPGSPAALAQGLASRQRGAAVEMQATQALEALARRLSEQDGVPYLVVTSLRVPASIPASHDRAKTEWDAVLLKQAPIADATPAWDICLLVEAKASVDAAATDLPTLLRGMRLLASADKNAIYAFNSRQGTVQLRGASLSALPIGAADLATAVLYCCDAPAEPSPRLLSAASRMQLLSAQGSLEFATALADPPHADIRHLDSVWNQLLESPRWNAVLHQYPILRQVRELMAHAEDLAAAIAQSSCARKPSEPGATP